MHWRIMVFGLLSCVALNTHGHPDTIHFPDACQKGSSLTIAAVGDILLHRPLQIKGAQTGFKSLWEIAIPYIKQADIAYGNLEGPIANGLGYSGYPTFNYQPGVADALQESGFDIISTANNHALDRSNLGIHKTLENLDRVGITYIGTRNHTSNQPWIKILRKNNIVTAWIACTQHTNGIVDTQHEILYCFNQRDHEFILNTVKNLKNKVDAIIITPHWGDEYATQPNAAQKQFAHELLNAGATLVLGSHPHVLQPVEKFTTEDGRQTFIAYSLGNFVSYQGSQKTKSTIILLIGLTKTTMGTIINGVRFVPMEMQNRQGINNIKISKAPGNNETIKKMIPDGNISHDNKISTNPECN